MWKLKDPTRIITLYVGIIFLSAAMYRIFNLSIAKQEMILLNMPQFFVILIIIVETFLGVAFLLNKYIKIASITAIAFLVSALTLSIILQGASLISQVGKLFVFDLEITDVFLHLNYLILLLFVYFDNKKSKYLS
jgi:uncharacterized membrane protein YphA (DoxX/SURF4 family)